MDTEPLPFGGLTPNRILSINEGGPFLSTHSAITIRHYQITWCRQGMSRPDGVSVTIDVDYRQHKYKETWVQFNLCLIPPPLRFTSPPKKS